MKWIKRLRRNATLDVVARHTLALRLRTVRKFLRRASRRPDQDVEDVHQLRVATRRATAALELYKSLLSKKQFRWWKRRLQAIRRAAAAARDVDVQLAYFREKPPSAARQAILERLRVERLQGQPAIDDIARQMFRKQRFAERARRLERSLKKRARRTSLPPILPWAQQQLARVAREFLATEPTDRQGPLEQLHAFRIQGKQLRYAIELLAFAFPKSLRREVYPVLEQLQEHLGGLNDALGRQNRLQTWLDQIDPASTDVATQLAAWRDEQQALVNRQRAAFWDGWSHRQQQLEACLARCLPRLAAHDRPRSATGMARPEATAADPGAADPEAAPPTIDPPEPPLADAS
jgi:CHAD domain-containing protein